MTCIPTAKNRCIAEWADNLSGGECPANASTRCLLNGVHASGGMSGWQPQWNTNTNVTITPRKDAQGNLFSYMINGTVENIGGDFGFGGGSMVCVDVASISGSWGFTFTGPSNGTTTVQLRNSYPNGAQVPMANVACGLTAIAGRWISPSPDSLGWSDGAMPNFGKQFWTYNYSNGRTASIACVE